MIRWISWISISGVIGAICAAVGWLAAALIGNLMMSPGNTDGDLGLGILAAAMLYMLALGFGIVGFVSCLIWLSRRKRPPSA